MIPFSTFFSHQLNNSEFCLNFSLLLFFLYPLYISCMCPFGHLISSPSFQVTIPLWCDIFDHPQSFYQIIPYLPFHTCSSRYLSFSPDCSIYFRMLIFTVWILNFYLLLHFHFSFACIRFNSVTLS